MTLLRHDNLAVGTELSPINMHVKSLVLIKIKHVP